MKTIKIFKTTDSRWAHRNGSRCTVLGPLSEDEYDREDVGPMFRIRFEDGTDCEAFEDELTD